MGLLTFTTHHSLTLSIGAYLCFRGIVFSTSMSYTRGTRSNLGRDTGYPNIQNINIRPNALHMPCVGTVTTTAERATSMHPSSVFLDVAPCSLVDVYQRLGGTCSLRLLGRRISRVTVSQAKKQKQGEQLKEN
jgi:hypothetical protein